MNCNGSSLTLWFLLKPNLRYVWLERSSNSLVKSDLTTFFFGNYVFNILFKKLLFMCYALNVCANPQILVLRS